MSPRARSAGAIVAIIADAPRGGAPRVAGDSERRPATRPATRCGRRSSPTRAISSTAGMTPILARSRSADAAVRLHLPDLRQLGLDPAVAVRQQPRDAGRRRRRRHDRRREGRPRPVARTVGRAGLRHGAWRPRSDQPLRWTVNCLVCHTAEIDGVAYLGAGTKTFDDLWLGEALKTLTSERWRSVSPRDRGGPRASRPKRTGS